MEEMIQRLKKFCRKYYTAIYYPLPGHDQWVDKILKIMHWSHAENYLDFNLLSMYLIRQW